MPATATVMAAPPNIMMKTHAIQAEAWAIILISMTAITHNMIGTAMILVGAMAIRAVMSVIIMAATIAAIVVAVPITACITGKVSMSIAKAATVIADTVPVTPTVTIETPLIPYLPHPTKSAFNYRWLGRIMVKI